jgi:hypothetical protein
VNSVTAANSGKVYVKIENMLFNIFDFSANDNLEAGEQMK